MKHNSFIVVWVLFIIASMAMLTRPDRIPILDDLLAVGLIVFSLYGIWTDPWITRLRANNDS